jgi:hypothetical protein
MMGIKRRLTLSARREVKTVSLEENLKSDGFPNFNKKSKPVDEGGFKNDRKTLKKWSKKRDNDQSRYN